MNINELNMVDDFE